MRAAVVLALALAAACGGNPKPADDAGPDEYDQIVVEPADAEVAVPLDGSVTKLYFVYGVTGAERTEITAQCTLAIDPVFGTVAGASVTVGPRGGRTQVRATCGARTAAADLTVTLTGAVVIGDGTPADAPQIFGGATPGTEPTRRPATVYPIDRAVSPSNIPPIDVQWTGAGNDLFHLAVRSTYVAVDVYTTATSAALPAAAWTAIADSTAGGELAFSVEGLARSEPGTRHVGAPVAIVMARDAIDRTAIYYWASSAGNIMSQTFGATTAPSLVRDQCTSCHSLSRAGTRLGYSRCVGNDCNQLFAGFLRYDPDTTSWVEAVNANDRAIRGSYTTFAPVGNPFPDDTRALAIVSMATGQLALHDPDTGAAVPSNLADVASHGPGAPRSALMADWSADGTRIVYASTPHPGQWIDLSDSAIATSTYSFAGGVHSFGEPTFLVSAPITLPGGVYNNFFFPSFSGDGALVVFNAARAAWRNFTVAGSPGQRLMLADTAGTWVKDLTAMNGGTVDADITWPHWAPESNGDYYWVVFSSERDYGHKITRANTDPSCVANGVLQCKQIWIGAISKAALASGAADPSAPPMWLPGQDPRADNISPFWTAGLVVN